MDFLVVVPYGSGSEARNVQPRAAFTQGAETLEQAEKILEAWANDRMTKDHITFRAYIFNVANSQQYSFNVTAPVPQVLPTGM